ncbi:MAG: hypothetical protein IPM82_28085 [Saprospiraceae bacterium]|nr:hypothetical protein [Saprospiraceae bacterium]
MKKIVLSCVIALLCMFVAYQSFGQKTQGKTSKATSEQKLPVCEDAIAAAKKLNQTQADAECRTVHQCVPCQDKKTNKATCKSVTVQPTCGTAATITKDEAKDASGKNQKALPFFAEIIQSPCGNGKVSLEAVVVQDGQASFDKKSQQAYSFKWTVDGKDAGTDSEVSCIQAKEASVKVTKKNADATITLYIKPLTEVSNTAASMAPVPTVAAIYKKTGCFGLCPIYEVQFFVDGRVKWNGKMNVGTLGIKDATVDRETIAQIARTADRIKFFNMDRRYPDYQVWDAPSTVIYLNMNGKEHQVENILDAPAELKELERIFDDIIKKNGWRTSPDKANQSAQSVPDAKN